ncbi:MAG: DUF2071 domain-containing protein [Mameliella sp.]|nr:DUF2071 domain-containing protein [Phaeodactylibacter sp.]
MARTFLTAHWRNLIMANYLIDPVLLQPYVPPGTELDSWNGQYFVSLVGFLFDKTRVLGLTIPFHQRFEEVNLRFYVRYNDAGTWKRGVVFISEIVPKPAITWVANGLYGENYMAMPMRYTWEESTEKQRYRYEWKHANTWNHLEVTTQGAPKPLNEGSEEHFIAEHYWGYARRSSSQTTEYEVQHPPWELRPVIDYNIKCDAVALYGETFAAPLAQPPSSVFLAIGSPIAVKSGQALNTP